MTTCGHRGRPENKLGAAYENVSFETSDGLTLKGWYVPSKNGAAVISFPGRRGPQRPARMLARHGYGVLVFDRRGEGISDGDPNAFGWNGDRDVKAAIDYLQTRADVDPDRIGGIGLSVGGEMMLEAAAEDHDLKAIVSEGAGARAYSDSMDEIEYERAPTRSARSCTRPAARSGSERSPCSRTRRRPRTSRRSSAASRRAR